MLAAGKLQGSGIVCAAMEAMLTKEGIEMCRGMGCESSVALSMYPKGYPIDPDGVEAREARLLQGHFQP